MIVDFPTLDSLDVMGKVGLIRVDYNVPLKEGQVTDRTRLRASLETIQHLFEKGARKLVLCSHLGRPKGEVKEEFRLKQIEFALREELSWPIKVLNECVGSTVARELEDVPETSLILLENVRFHPEETQGDLNFAKKLAGLADFFVLDAFGAAHRAHASVVGPSHSLPCAAGRLMEKEITNLGFLLTDPPQPFVTLIGGAKVSDKVEILEKLIEVCDHVLVGGAMAYTFLKQQGKQVGNSLVEDEKLELAENLLNKATQSSCQLHLPVDHVCGREFSESTEVLKDVEDIPEGFMGLDIGEKTCEQYAHLLSDAKTILWNGPMGVFELTPFAEGTRRVGVAAAESPAYSVVGGGDSVAAAYQFGLADQFTHVSTGGGASLEFLSGRLLPGLEALQKKRATN